VTATVPEMPEIDLSGLSLTFDETPQPGRAAADGSGAGKDEHWYDVQTKFDLAKAYQEMGDKEGAREILQEILKEGDPGQQGEARKLIESLG
jgi:pilus assembly protein FimV